MALNTKTSAAQRNRALDAITARANNGKLRIYDGSQPADADTAITTQTLLAELTFGATAFGAASAGSASANAITSDPSANATGTATWFRIVESDGTTPVMDGSVGTSGCNMNMATTSIVAAAIISVSSLTVSISA